MLEKIKPFQHDILLVLVIILVALASFGLGRLSSVREYKTPITITTPSMAGATSLIGESSQNKYVGSKNGTKYHLPWCSGAQRISEANKVWFRSVAEAEKAGYTPASNCKGI